jgi:hypothetical protein
MATGLVATMVEAPLDLQSSLTIPNDFLQICAEQSIPTAGNAAGNTMDLFDLTGENMPPGPLPDGFTAKGYIAMAFSCLSGILGIAVIAWYAATSNFFFFFLFFSFPHSTPIYTAAFANGHAPGTAPARLPQRISSQRRRPSGRPVALSRCREWNSSREHLAERNRSTCVCTDLLAEDPQSVKMGKTPTPLRVARHYAMPVSGGASLVDKSIWLSYTHIYFYVYMYYNPPRSPFSRQ